MDLEWIQRGFFPNFTHNERNMQESHVEVPFFFYQLL